MGGFKLTGLGAPSSANDSARLTDLTLGGDITGTLAASTVSKIQTVTVTGVTGTGKAVLDTSPTVSGATHTGTTKIAGLTAGVGSTAGNIGEQAATRNGASFSTGTPKTAHFVNLGAGNWLVVVQFELIMSGGALVTNFECCISTVDNTFSPIQTDARLQVIPKQTANITTWPAMVTGFVNSTGSANYYAVANADFTSGSLTVNATLNAVRVS